jgi:hypothetical protein
MMAETAFAIRDERRSERFDVRLPGIVVDAQGVRHPAVVRNLSFYGFMAECDLLVNRGQLITVEMENRPVIDATIAWGRDGHLGGSFAAPLSSEDLVKLL